MHPVRLRAPLPRLTMSHEPNFTFIDLFAGIGGIRLAFEEIGGECVYTAEWDKWARKTYEAFFGVSDGSNHRFVTDINLAFEDCGVEHPEPVLKGFSTRDETTVPEHEVLLAGFPCQPFSLAGVSKKNALGRKHGFDDPTQGTLFFNIKEILLKRRPRAFLLENVKNLRSHDKKNAAPGRPHGRTWQVIEDALHEAGYAFTAKVIDASRIVPQHRERIFIVGFDTKQYEELSCGVRPDNVPFWDHVDRHLAELRDLERVRYHIGADDPWPRVGAILEDDVSERYTLTPNLWKYLKAYRAKHEAAGNGFGYGLVTADSRRTRTISARYYKDGSEALVDRGKEARPRRLTPLECLRLQGFPERLEKHYVDRETQPVSDTQAYRQFGNSVAVPVVTAIAKAMKPFIRGERQPAEVLGEPQLRQGQLPLENAHGRRQKPLATRRERPAA